MKTMRQKTPIKVFPKAAPLSSRGNSGNKLPSDPVHVYCRVRPLPCESDLSCLRVAAHNMVVLTPPEIAINYKISNLKETQYLFRHVFEPAATQHELYATVAQPLVEALIRGKNGLLFTYGVTGSGKTYTMTGDIQHRGIMPRCLDALFRTISDYQAKKFVFKPDRLNGFDILSDADAMLERQAELHSRMNRMKRKDTDPELASKASVEPSEVSGIDEDNIYSVFITYVEVYNNCVYDLLEETTFQKTMQSKMVREDGNRNMFVHGVTEIEVKTMEEALDVFVVGQKRKRVGHTILNAESSRSHSVFTIRLVQAPVDSQGEHVVQDRANVTISQLSLVDLAGSERTNRTGNTGQRLREAGNINNSLMTLRTCLEILRENQMTGSSKKVPYRDSKITHLFKNYFDGEGQVRMVVCVNPRAEDYDETAQVMKFAEMTQDVQITRPTPVKVDVGLTPGRRKAHQIFKKALTELEKRHPDVAGKVDIDLGLVYTLGSNFPEMKMDEPESQELIQELIKVLEMRISKRKLLCDDFDARQNQFRANLMKMERENVEVKAENNSLKAALNHKQKKLEELEKRISHYEGVVSECNLRNCALEDQVRELRHQINQKTQQMNQLKIDGERQAKKYNSKMAVETKTSRELELRLQGQKNKLEEQVRERDEQLRLVSQIIQTPHRRPRSNSVDRLAAPTPVSSQKSVAPSAANGAAPMPRSARGVPVANPRHRRSRSAGPERWLEHRAPNPVPLGTIFQPYYSDRKSVTKLSDARDVTNAKASKYCLISQEADTEGEVETKIFKGDVIPTTGGGAQVIFNDVECLKQFSPTKSPARRKRTSPAASAPPLAEVQTTSSKCSTAIEGHGGTTPKKPKY
ncbi:kinesin-like protein KIF23 [Sabethes cyaneus]|uniref:kinesin-like protein KIF23 n=1 Tax=Sabethes cyaneus TaxID=53552 RepID=UPI00237ECAF4|nr:kinesin-like protein KIF23 [Sabethes cyaneus]